MAQPTQQQQQFMPPQAPTITPTPNQAFNFPPQKRQRLSPNPPSQPGSPYVQSPYGMSSNGSTPSSSNPPNASPVFTPSLPPNVYTTPYSTSTGNTNMNGGGLSFPQSGPSTPQYQQPSANFPMQHQTAANQPPPFNNYSLNPQGPGAMGPPSKPAEKPKEDGIDPMDVLGGTGIDLREEEQYTFQLYNKSFNSQLTGSQSGTLSSGHSFTQFPPGDEASFYGAGPANAAAENPNGQTQDEFLSKEADKLWRESAHNLAVSRQRELNNPFLQVGLVHSKMSRIARDNGLGLRTGSKGDMGIMTLPENFSNKRIEFQSTSVPPDGVIITTSGSFIPFESMLVDQLALLSIATKHRLRGLLEGAHKLAKGRQTGSHGVIPAEWADVAAPSGRVDSSALNDGDLRSGWESAVTPHSNTRKRSFSVANNIPTPISDGAKTSLNPQKITNEVINALRETARLERDFEEARLRKRNERNAGETAAPRQSSVIPGTPGSIAPEMPEKAPTKKEAKKKAEAKVNDAASHAAANVTTAQFLFGKKKKYNWMTAGAGGAGSGASTPGRINTQLAGAPVANAVPERLTSDGARRLGAWREDKEKGMKIQIRDWIATLEDDGHEKKALQKAYANLDHSEPK